MTKLSVSTQVIDNEEVTSLISQEQTKEIHEKLLFYYLSQAKDVKKCPNKECDYAGTILMNACDDNITCEKCNKEWRDPVHLNKNSILSYFNPNSDREILSLFVQVVFGKPCPTCKIVIFKDFGCQYMNCTACKSEFCWNCLEITPGHRHTDSNEILCGLNYLFWKLMFFYFAILSINFHFYFRFSTFMYIEDLISWYFGVFIVALIFNIIINSTILGGFAAIADCNCWGIVLTIIGLLFLGLEIFWAIQVDYGRSVANCSIVLECIFIGGIIIAFICYYFTKPQTYGSYYSYEDDIEFNPHIAVLPNPVQENIAIQNQNNIPIVANDAEILLNNIAAATNTLIVVEEGKENIGIDSPINTPNLENINNSDHLQKLNPNMLENVPVNDLENQIVESANHLVVEENKIKSIN